MKRIAITMLAALSPVFGVGLGHAQQSGYDLYQTALVMERSSGRMLEAVRLYEQIATDFAADRALAAQALLRLAHVQETLGDPKAGATYSRVLSDYADQTDMAERARERLAALRPAAPGEAATVQVARMLMEDPHGCLVFGMRPSPDGTRVAYSDICRGEGGNLFVRDLASGETEQVTSDGWYFGAVWSPDGTRLAVAQADFQGSAPQIIDLASGVVETPAPLEGLNFSPRDWSSDGEHLTGVLTNADRTKSTIVISLRTGDHFTLAPRVAQGGNESAFSPDGRHVAFTDLVDGNQDIYVMDVASRTRRRVTTHPDDDFGALWSPDGSTIVFQNENGAWAIRMAAGRPQGEPRLVRGDSYWGAAWTANGYYHLVSNSSAEAYRLPVDPRSGRPTGSPELLPDVNGGNWFSWSPDMQQIAASSWGDAQHIQVTQGQSVTALNIGSEILTANLWWSGDGREILFTSAARSQRDKRATVFALNPSDGRVRELFPRQDSINHVHVSRDGRQMAFFRQIGPQIAGELLVSDLGDSDGRVLAPGSTSDGDLSTHYGQPRFSPDGSQILFLRLDQSGVALETFMSSLWVVSVAGGEPRKLATGPSILWPRWDPTGRMIVYQEKSAPGPGAGVLRVVSLETGERHDVLAFEGGDEEVDLRTWSPDGRWIGFMKETGTWEYWVTEDVLGEDR